MCNAMPVVSAAACMCLGGELEKKTEMWHTGCATTKKTKLTGTTSQEDILGNIVAISGGIVRLGAGDGKGSSLR